MKNGISRQSPVWTTAVIAAAIVMVLIANRSTTAQEQTDDAVTVSDGQPAEQADAQANDAPQGDAESVDASAEQPQGTSAGGPPVDQPAPGLSIGSTRDQLEKWVETRRIISQEKQELKLAKEMLTERIALVESEIESLRGKIKEAESNIAKTDEQYDERTAENERLKAAADLLKQTIAALETQTEQLLTRAPAPVRDRVKPLSQQIPDDPETTKLPIANRFQNVIGILNDVNKANSEILIASEERQREDGTSAEVTVMYLGIAKAYYVGGNGSFGGVGTPSEDGWVWKPIADPQAVADAIDIYNNKKVASFVNLPIEIQ